MASVVPDSRTWDRLKALLDRVKINTDIPKGRIHLENEAFSVLIIISTLRRKKGVDKRVIALEATPKLEEYKEMSFGEVALGLQNGETSYPPKHFSHGGRVSRKVRAGMYITIFQRPGT